MGVSDLAAYARRRVRRARYNNASEVAREALRRMRDDDIEALRRAKPIAKDIISNLTAQQLEDIRLRVRAGIDSVEAGKYQEYEGRDGLRRLADGVKARGRRRLAREV